MSILDIGRLKTGHASEADDGVVRLYDKKGYPVVEIYSRLDENGNPIDSDMFLDVVAREVIELWNTAVCKKCLDNQI